MNTPTNTALFWACLGQKTLLREWDNLPESLRASAGNGSLMRDHGLQFVGFPQGGTQGIGLPVPGFALEQGFTLAKLASEAATVRGNVIRILESLGMKEPDKFVEIFGVGEEPQRI
ncbi:MAG: hypothetical protein Q7R93_05295 [bacterium]|nr:hypothetical protein [bacterium]